MPIRKADLEIPPTTGLSGALSSFIDIANGAYAYSEVVGDPFELPLYGDSSQTTYRIAAVGLGKMLGVGLQPGDENQLTADEIAEARLVRLRAAVFDVILPLATSVVLPRLTYGGWKSIFEQPSNLELFADYINLVNQMPGLKEAIDSGSLGEIVNVAWGYINPATGSKTFQSATVSAVRKIVGLLANRGWATIEDVEGADKALGVAGQVFNALGLVNMGMGAADFLVTASHIDRSNWCDIWSVTVTEPRVTLVPETSVIAPGDLLSLEAHVPEAEGGSSADQPVFTYRYTCSGQVGVINDHVHAGTSFESSSRYLLYEAKEDQTGTDTITVEVFEVELAERTLVGKATATVEVLGTAINITPAQPTVQAGKATNLIASIQPLPNPGTTLEYRWTCTSQQGTLNASESNAVYSAKADGNGDDTVSLEVYEIKGTNKILLGKTNALVTVEPFSVNLTPSEPSIWGFSSVALNAYVVPSPPAEWKGRLVYQWTNTATQGSLFGKNLSGSYVRSNSFSSYSSSATYTANANPQGSDTVSVNVYLYQIEGLVLLGTAVSRITFNPTPISYGRIKTAHTSRIAPDRDHTPWTDFWVYVEFDRLQGYETNCYRITGHGFSAEARIYIYEDPVVTVAGGGSEPRVVDYNDHWADLNQALGTPSTHVVQLWWEGVITWNGTLSETNKYFIQHWSSIQKVGSAFSGSIWEAVPLK